MYHIGAKNVSRVTHTATIVHSYHAHLHITHTPKQVFKIMDSLEYTAFALPMDGNNPRTVYLSECPCLWLTPQTCRCVFEDTHARVLSRKHWAV